MKKRALSWLLALTMLLTLAPQTLPVWASATGEKSNTATQTESKLSANTYSALGLSRSIKPSDEGLDQGKQPYGDAVEGNTVATNVINELYVNFNGSIHYGWSILDNIPMEYRDNSKIGTNWKSKDNSYGAMGYWRSGASVDYENGNSKNGALFAKNGSIDDSTTYNHVESGSDINSANKHIVYQYSKSEAFSPNTGKDNYVAELVVDDNGDVHLYLYQVEGGNKRYVRGTKIGHNPFVGDASNKTNVIWNWEYDAMFDIAAGDMDGDGYDEIAVYTATGTESDNKQEVHLYRYEGGALTEITTQAVTKPNNGNASGQKLKLGTAVVTLAFGDLNADDKDELVIAENMGYGASNIADGKVRIYALQKNNELKQQKEISLKIQEQGSNLAMARYANVATGDIDNDNQDELVIAGYPGVMGTIAGTAVSGINGDYISYNIIDGKDYRANGWETVTFDKKDLLGRVVDNNDQLIPPVSLTCAATQGVGYAEQVFLSGCLYSVDTSKNSDNTNKFSLEKLTEISTNREYKKDNGKKANKEEIFVVNVVAGNFNGNRNGQEQIVYAFGMKHDDSDRYWYDIGYINKKNPGNSDSDYWYGQEQVMNFESSYNRDSNKRRASLYLSLAAVDCDDDSTLMRYKGQEVTWTKPEVLTILQSAPYFQDLEDTRGYINQGQTGYGKGKGSGSSATAGTSLSVGTYVSFEQDFSVFGVKIASIQAEAQTKHSFNYGYEHNQTVETEVNYSGSAGDDYAVVYAVPFMEYQYETWVPGYEIPRDNNAYQNWKNEHITKYLTDKDANWVSKLNAAQKQAKIDATAKELGLTQGKTVKGSWQPCTVSVPMTPRTVMLSVDDYDDIANVTEGLQPIRGNILNSTPGDPTTYDAVDKRKGFNKIGTLQTVTKAQGSNISVTQTATTEEEHSFEYEYEFEAKVGAGAGGLTVGVLAGFGANAGGGISKSTSKSYSATVDNLPSDADGYALSWQFGWRKAKLNNNDVLVLEYQQKDTKAKPSPPKNLRVESVTSNSVTLTWDPVTGAGAYKIYQVEKSSGDLFEMKTLAGTATSWTHEKLNSNSSYIYVAETVTQSGETSITSKEVNASTLEANGNFIITKQPELTETTYAGGEVNLSVEAEYLNADNTRNELHYQWQVYDKSTKQWKSLRNGNGATYTATVTDENDGDRYRCRVYHTSNLYLYSTEVTLNVGLAKSATTLTPMYPSGVSAQAVKSTYFITEKVTVAGEYEDVPVIENGRTKYSYQSGNETKYVYVATTIDADKKENYHYYGTSDSTTEITQVEQQVLTFGDESYDINLTGGQTPTGTKTYTVPKGTGDVTKDTVYTAQTVYTFNVAEPSKTICLYHCPETSTEEGNEFWFVEVTEGGQLKQYVADVEKVKKLKIDDNTLIDISSLAVFTTKSTDPATTTVQKKQAGDTVKLTVNVADANTGNNKIPTGSVTFKVVNTTGDGGFTKDVEIENGKAEISWNPTTSGVYTVTAIYSGSDTFKESQSQSYTINVVTPGEKKLVVSGENMTYGESRTLTATLFEGGSASGTTNVSTTDVSNNVTYTVMRDGTDVTNQNELSFSGTFTPKQAGTYTITASYTDPSAAGQAEGESGKANNVITSTKVITVNRKTVTVSPEVDENTKEIKCEPKGAVTQEDTELIKSKITILCDGKKENAAAGVYPITVTYESDDTINSKYLIVCDNSKTYEIKDDVIKVTNDTKINSNGKVTLSYIYKDHTYEVVSQNGGVGYIPKEAKLRAMAQPDVGYQVEQWLVDGKLVDTGDGHTPNTSLNIDVQTPKNNSKEISVGATFTQIFYRVNFSFQNAENGTITAKYANDNGATGTAFNSDSELSPLQKIQLTATPKNGKVISGWQIKTGNDVKTVTNKDGTNYTGNTYTLSAISGNTEVIVLTESSINYPVTVTLVDEKGDPLGTTNATVLFSPVNQETTEAAGKYTYPGKKHQDLTISLNISDSLIVDSWTAGEGQTMPGTLSSDKKKLTISNLQGDAGKLDLTVKCVTPNMYPVTVESNENGSVDIYKNLESKALTLTNHSVEVQQASSLRVVLKPEEGYQVLSVKVDNNPLTTLDDVANTAEGKAFTINSVDGPTTIKVQFVKKPVISFSPTTTTTDAYGSVTANNSPLSGGTVSYGSKENIVFTATPKVGYEVDTWKVKVGDADPTTLTSDQITKVANSDNQTYTYTPDATTGITSDVTVEVSFKALDQHTVTFSVVDTNGTGEAGGENGTLAATAERKGMANYETEYANFQSGGIVYAGSTVTFTAAPNEGYRVKEWRVGTEVYRPDGSTTDFIKERLTLDAVEAAKGVTVQFTPIGNKVIIQAEGQGTITSARVGSTEQLGNISEGFVLQGGSAVTITAAPSQGYEVMHWIVNGKIVSGTENQNKYTYSAKTNSSGALIKAVFQPVNYTVRWSGENGTVTKTDGETTKEAQVRGGTSIIFHAAPDNGYVLSGWTVNGETVENATNPDFTWSVPLGVPAEQEYTVKAIFQRNATPLTVTYQVEGNVGGTIATANGQDGSVSVVYGGDVTFTAEPDEYYSVKEWKVGSNTVPNSDNKSEYTLQNVTEDTMVTVVFQKALSFTVGYEAGQNGTIQAKENGQLLQLKTERTKEIPGGSTLEFKAVPATGSPNYMVAKWTVNNVEVTKDNMSTLGVTMEQGHPLSNTLTIENLSRNVVVKAEFVEYTNVAVPSAGTGYVIQDVQRVPAETYANAPTNEIRKNGDLTFTVKPNGEDHYMTIGTLIVNGYDCIANKATTAGLDTQKCDSVSAKKNDDGSYTVTITNVKDEVEKTIVAHQVIVGGLTVPMAFAGKEELNSAEKIRTKLEASFTGSKDGMAFYDIALKYYNGTQWVDVDETNFPANGVDVVLPYPTGTNKQDRFQIVHMLTHRGHEGEIERITASNETDGLHFHVDSLSPFGVSWTKYVAPTPGGGGGGVVSTYTLTFDTNGGSAIDKITKDSGTTIDLAAYKPTRAGYTFAGWFSDKALTKAVTSVKLTANTTVYAKWTQNGGTAQNPFVDVKEGAYYYDAVLWAVEQKITSGTSATTFSPDASCTRAQMVTFLWRAAGSPKAENGKNPFTDVKADAYYYDAVLWAVEKGVTSGTSATTFSPDATVTRGQTVTFLYRNAGSPEVSGTMPFTDVEADAYYAKAVQWAVQQKITTGTSETTFSPMSDCTRGQIVTFLYRAK